MRRVLREAHLTRLSREAREARYRRTRSRERPRWRSLLCALAAVAIAFGASSGPDAHASPGERPCRAASFGISVDTAITPPTGAHPLSLRLVNRGTACFLRGYPGVQLLASAQRTLPFAVRTHGDQMVTGRAPTDVRVRRGGSAWIVIDKYRCDLGDRALARIVRIAFPDAPKVYLLLAIPHGYVIGYCGPGDPGSVVYVSPFEGTLRAALARH